MPVKYGRTLKTIRIRYRLLRLLIPIYSRTLRFYTLDVIVYFYLFISIYLYFVTHKQHYTVLNKRRKEEERMMTIVARRPKGNYKAYVSYASSILTLQLEKEIERMATDS